MGNPEKSTSENELVTLREGIKLHYQAYHQFNPVRFPLIDFNTNRANYEPLRESFEEEFFVVRKLDRQQKTIHIPSTATLALLFTDDSYIPTQKIWNTCWSYAQGQVKVEASPVVDPQRLKPPLPVRNYTWLLSGGLGLLIGLVLGAGLNQYASVLTFSQTESASDPRTITVSQKLVIDRPRTKSRVPPQFLVSGQAKPGEVVWPVVRPQDTDYYYVQFPVLVTELGFWITAIEVYGAGFENEGKTHQLRAFINPVQKIKTSDVLRAWPDAEHSTDIVEIVMDGSKVVK